MRSADWMLNFLILVVIETAIPGKANSLFKDGRNETTEPLRMIYKALERETSETRSIAEINSTYQQSSGGPSVGSSSVSNLKGVNKSLDNLDDIIPTLSPKIAASHFSANFTHGFLEGNLARLARREAARGSFAAGDRTSSVWQDSTVNETHNQSGTSLNEDEKGKENFISQVSSEETSNIHEIHSESGTSLNGDGKNKHFISQVSFEATSTINETNSESGTSLNGDEKSKEHFFSPVSSEETSTINETHSESGISLNGDEKNKELYTSSEAISTVTLAPMSSSTISPLEDFFQSWEAILIVTVAAVCIFCQFILCMMTRTRLRYVTCCERVLSTFELDKDEESLSGEDGNGEWSKRKTSGTSWTSDHLKIIDYFDYLSETKNVDDMESADSSRRPSNDTLGNKSLKEDLKGLKGLFRQQSVDSQDSFFEDIERRQSGDSLGDGPVSILRSSSGDSLDKRPVDILTSSGDSLAQRPKRKRKVSIDTSRRSSSDSLDGRPADFSSRSCDCYARRVSGESFDGGLRGILRRSSGDSYYRRPSGDSLGDGPMGILRRASGDSYYRRQSGDSLGDGPMGILRRASGDSLDGIPASLPRNKLGDSVKWKSSDAVHMEGDLHVEDSPGSSNDSMEGNLSDQGAPNLKSLVPPKRRISLEHKVSSRLLESIVEIHDEVTRSPSGSCCEHHQSHSAGVKIDGL